MARHGVKRKSAIDGANLRLYGGRVNLTSLPTAAEIESAARQSGLSINELCRRAGVAPSTFHRWKGGEHSPAVRIVEEWCRVIAAAATEQELS